LKSVDQVNMVAIGRETPSSAKLMPWSYLILIIIVNDKTLGLEPFRNFLNIEYKVIQRI